MNFSNEKGDVLDFYNQLKSNSSGIGYFTLNGSRNIAAYVKCNVGNIYVINYMPVARYISAVSSLRNGILIVMVISIFISGFVILLLSMKISKPITSAVEYIKAIANGDFTVELPAKAMKSKDEIGILINSLNIMQKSISDMITTVMGESQHIYKSVDTTTSHLSRLNEQIEEVSATTEEMSAGMEKTAASAEEINSTTVELENAVGSMAQKAQEGAGRASGEISKRAQNLKETAVASQRSANDMRKSVDTDLRQAIEQSKAVDQINLLAESILQITSQTNLLALNAAIEAARAGEQEKALP